MTSRQRSLPPAQVAGAAVGPVRKTLPCELRWRRKLVSTDTSASAGIGRSGRILGAGRPQLAAASLSHAGYNLNRHILLSSCVSKRMTAAKIAATARTRSSPTLLFTRVANKDGVLVSTNRCWARDKRDDDAPRRNSAGRRLRNFAPQVTVGVTDRAGSSSERALRSGQPAKLLAEEAGFEPASPFGPAVFKTAAFSLSATPPWL